MERLQRQIDFLLEIDKLKQVYRQTLISDGSRQENDAEHTWHLAMLAITLAEYANDPELDVLRVIKMLLVHDLVEIDAGDTYAYDELGHLDKEEREQKAAARIFPILPEDQAEELYSLWMEFEQRQTPEARFASACDRLQPLLLNYHTEGLLWKKRGITSEQVLKRNQPIAGGAEPLWDYVRKLVESAVAKGYLAP
ncbi:HD domain-containing protein [Brevibacillus migulae]|uniref:HD domain-containing protein n=1 Tax=Brevibacillus migulae TaxID=1644114 RepID=UPI00106DDF82|nr:HD domain-containing protein [Brevibacillus migulae]